MGEIGTIRSIRIQDCEHKDFMRALYIAMTPYGVVRDKRLVVDTKYVMRYVASQAPPSFEMIDAANHFAAIYPYTLLVGE